MRFATLLTPSSVFKSRTSFSNIPQLDPVIPKETKYDLHCCDVRGDLLPPPHDTNTSCSVVKSTSERLPWETKEHTADEIMESRFY